MNNNWEYDYSGLYQNGAPSAQNADAPNTLPGAGVLSTGGAPAAPEGMPVPQKKKGGRVKRVAACAALVAVCGAAGVGGGYWGGVLARQNAPSGPVIYQAPAPSSTSDGASLSPTHSAATLSVPEISSKAGPSVVEVTTEAVTTNRFFGE